MERGTRSLGAIGVLMAGGEGRRMAAGGQGTPKPLVPVLGAPLVERNVWAFLRAGITDIRIVVGANPAGSAVRQWTRNRGASLAAAMGARIAVVLEPVPQGNCGGLALAIDVSETQPAVLAFSDNLTDLNLKQLLATQEHTSASVVLAVHDEPMSLPYGVVEVSGYRVTGYREKPSVPIRVGSGLAVVGADSRALIDGPTGLVDLVNRSVAANQLVVPHEHTARWVDVNDPAKVSAAEAMVRSHPEAFELWCAVASDRLGAAGGTGVLLDEVDKAGRPVRVWSGSVDPAGLSAEGQLRVNAWLSASSPCGTRSGAASSVEPR